MIKKFSELKKPFIIAEIGNNHEGSFSNAVKLIDLAAWAGATAVKFQTYKVENYINPIQDKRYKRLTKFQLTFEEFKKLKLHANKKKLYFISTPLDLDSANFLKKNSDYLKIASGDNNYFDLIESVLKSKKPLIISSAFADIKLLDRVIKLVKSKKDKNFYLKKFALLQCTGSYPTKHQDVNLKVISSLKKRYRCNIGFSDHTTDNVASISATSFGVMIFEKHFTLDNNFSSFIDHKVSLAPKAFKKYVEDVENAYLSLGNKNKRILKCEKEFLINNRRTLVLKKNISKNSMIYNKDLIALRPELKKQKNNIIHKDKSTIRMVSKQNYKKFDPY
tara:strand:- start:82 stop:1083 length:1002 start_codon:yes stop_codon:yes gene_type:complete